MTDQELLELAAKAAGYTLTWGEKYSVGGDEVDCTDLPYIKSSDVDVGDRYWNPLTDDGDALRLAVKLRIHVHHFPHIVEARTERFGYQQDDSDPYAATRRAIVRAAAELGRGKG